MDVVLWFHLIITSSECQIGHVLTLISDVFVVAVVNGRRQNIHRNVLAAEKGTFPGFNTDIAIDAVILIQTCVQSYH